MSLNLKTPLRDVGFATRKVGLIIQQMELVACQNVMAKYFAWFAIGTVFNLGIQLSVTSLGRLQKNSGHS